MSPFLLALMSHFLMKFEYELNFFFEISQEPLFFVLYLFAHRLFFLKKYLFKRKKNYKNIKK
jgi:hypothetical protein